MDLLAHILWGSLLLGPSLPVALGSLGPDPVYGLALLLHGRLEGLKDTRVYRAGMRAHSALLWAAALPAFLLAGGDLLSYWLAYGLHIALDVVSHRRDGPRFLYPLSDEHAPRGLYDPWDPLPAALNFAVLAALWALRVNC